MAKKIVFTVEDDVHILELIKYNLENAGYSVSAFENGESLLHACRTAVPDMFLLDVMLPGIDGFELCKSLKNDTKTKNIPVIILTAKSEEFDKVFGLEIGADDYITKPFSIRELQARVKALFRRSEVTNSNEKDVVLKYMEFELDIEKHIAKRDGEQLELTVKEFDFFRFLIINKGKVLSREVLLDKIWGYDYAGETRTVDVHVRYLRQKIEKDANTPNYIETVRGIGYRLKDYG